MPTSRLRLALPVLLALSALLLACDGGSSERDEPGEFDYYALVLSWTPSYCLGDGRSRKDGQCDRHARRAFTLHGLWPQYEQGWPEDCDIGKRPWVPQAVIDGMRGIMSSKSLIIHEYRAHGTCSGLDAAQYFQVARALYDRIDVPARFAAPDARLLASPDEIEREFVAANPWLKPEMMSVTCRRSNLLDVRICFGRDLVPRACGVNEDQKRLCRASEIAVPPVSP